MRFLSESERQALHLMLQNKAEQNGINIDERGIESDNHLVFECLHVLANGIPERLYAMLHFKGREAHKEANAGLTMLNIKRVAEHGSAGMEVDKDL